MQVGNSYFCSSIARPSFCGYNPLQVMQIQKIFLARLGNVLYLYSEADILTNVEPKLQKGRACSFNHIGYKQKLSRLVQAMQQPIFFHKSIESIYFVLNCKINNILNFVPNILIFVPYNSIMVLKYKSICLRGIKP